MSDLSPYGAAERLQDLIIHGVLGGTMDQVKYKDLRRQLVSDNHIGTHVPQFIRDRRDVREVDQYLARNFDNDADRKEFLWDTFRPLLEYLEFAGTPVQASTTELLKSVGMPGVHEAWRRALDRYVTDPAGAITSARTLLEEVCKHILAELRVAYDSAADLPKLYKLTAEKLNIAPGQHVEPVFKQILGGCTSVVEGLGALRNRVGDAHGGGPRAIKPAPRHAQLAIDLAGTVASYLFATWRVRKHEANESTADGGPTSA